MNTPLITWACIVGLILLLLSVRLFQSVHMRNAHHMRHHIQPISIGSEREVFFAPGDQSPLNPDEADYDQYDA